mmetsp:Transcript_7147/g.10249  ORF Transcript_7147/g.10249 Transcript_7147/m.10249 type:complete len:552 (+) Transcript_7147:111-1766(+)
MKKVLIKLFFARLIILVFTSYPWDIGAQHIQNVLTFYLRGEALSSTLVNPIYSLSHLREGKFLIQNHSFGSHNGKKHCGSRCSRSYANVYRKENVTFFHLPPLVLAMFEPFLIFIHDDWQHFLLSLFMTVIDLVLALKLHDLVSRFMSLNSYTSSTNIREEALQQHMDPRIQPKNTCLLFEPLYPTVRGESISNQVSDSPDTTKLVKTPIINGEQAKTNENIPVEEQKKVEQVVHNVSTVPKICAIFYFANPISIVVCSSGICSIQGLCFFFLTSSLLEACVGMKKTRQKHDRNIKPMNIPNIPNATLFLAFATYCELFYFVFLVPLISLVNKARGGKNLKKTISYCIIYFTLWTTILQLLSMMLVGRNNYSACIHQTYGQSASFSDLNPNLGLLWYLFIQMFQRFRPFFVVYLNLLPYIFIFPLLIRLHQYPLDLVVVFNFIWTIFKPSPTLHDLVFALTFYLASPCSLSRTSNVSTIALIAIPVPVSLYTMDYWLWLGTGVGNANYMFFQCLAYNIFITAILVEFLSGAMKRDKALRLTEKMKFKSQKC